MTKKEFEKLSEDLKMDICREIAYEYAAFVPKDEKNALSKFKSFINLSDKRFLDRSVLEKTHNGRVFPYNVITEKIERRVENYYQEFDLGINAQKLLADYGDRGEQFSTYFTSCLMNSQNTTKNAVTQELFRQLCNGNDAKSAIKGVGDVITRRTSSFGKLLESLFSQMEQLVVLWDYQDNGYTKYRINSIGENCEECQGINGKILNVADATIGETLSPFHPNCDCSLEILDEQGNVVYTNANTDKDKQDWGKYLKSSLKQLVLGNYTDDVNLFGTLLQVLAGVVGVDLPLDIRDLFYDVTNFKLTKEHIAQTILDAAALLPIVGGVKYIDEAGTVLKSGAKYGDEVALIKKLESNGIKFFEKDIVFITKDKTGQIVWLETGTKSAGLEHIIDKHGSQFNSKGISNEEISDYIMEAVQHGSIVGYQRTRTVYEFTYKGQKQRVAVQIGDNGFIIGANPKSMKGEQIK